MQCMFGDERGKFFSVHRGLLRNHKEMLLLARLRSELECFSLDAEDLITDEKLWQEFAARLNEIINTISQMICGAMGGKECQRKA